MHATAKDLRFHTKELLDSVSRGEEVIITYRGKPCAKLVPLDSESPEKKSLALFGMWKNDAARENVNAYVDDLRKGRSLP